MGTGDGPPSSGKIWHDRGGCYTIIVLVYYWNKVVHNSSSVTLSDKSCLTPYKVVLIGASWLFWILV